MSTSGSPTFVTYSENYTLWLIQGQTEGVILLMHTVYTYAPCINKYFRFVLKT